MRWKTYDEEMKKKYDNRETREVTKYLLFPKSIDGETRWLETATIFQCVAKRPDYLGKDDDYVYVWRDVRFK